MLTFTELERVAYIKGFSALAEKYHKLSEFDAVADCLDSDFELNDTMQDQIDLYVEKQVEKQCPNYAEYKQFFDDCFYMLKGHYFCPSVTSDYDCSVIFDAICKGEAA